MQILNETHQQYNNFKGYSEIVYDTTTDNKLLPKVNICNRIYKLFQYSDKYCEAEIQNYKFIFDTINLDSLNEVCYNCKNMKLIKDIPKFDDTFKIFINDDTIIV